VTLPDDEALLPYDDDALEIACRRSLRRSLARRALATRLRVRRRRARGGSGTLTAVLAAGALLAPLAAAQDASSPALLTTGSSGAGVAAVQRALAVAVTGRYDAATRAAVRDFQRRAGLVVDGIVGPQTRRALGAWSGAASGVGSSPVAVAGAAAGGGGAVAGAAGGGSASAVGATGSPVGAEAAATLARIAACESGGDPTAVSPHGRYRGKYQFSRATWRALGGTGDPAAAPEAEQDRLAAHLLAAQGTKPWPACGAHA
jgi:peptidoglycan hydrolase-like protein with peptidoglycan-binding domain